MKLNVRIIMKLNHKLGEMKKTLFNEGYKVRPSWYIRAFTQDEEEYWNDLKMFRFFDSFDPFNK